MNDITPEHAKWLDDAPKRIADRVRTTLFDLRTGDDQFVIETVDRVVRDPVQFVETIFRAAACHENNENFGEHIRMLMLGYLEADAELTEAEAVYDPVFDSPPWEE